MGVTNSEFNKYINKNNCDPVREVHIHSTSNDGRENHFCFTDEWFDNKDVKKWSVRGWHWRLFLVDEIDDRKIITSNKF